MAYNRDRENSYGGFQYRWNYDEYQKSLQRKRKKSAARGMRAFCLTTLFVFLLCTASLLVVLTASLLRGTVYTLPAAAQTTDGTDSFRTEPDGVFAPSEPQTPTDQTMPTTEPLDDHADVGPAPVLQQKAPTPAKEPDPAPAATNDPPAEAAPEVLQGSIPENYASADSTNMFTVLTLSEIAETCSVSTVTVQCSSKGYQGIGSGFFLSEDGYIVTNYHVIRPYDTYRIITCDGTSYEAQIVSTEPEFDVALLKIDAEQMPVVSVGSSEAAAIGDQVVAIGTPGSVNFAGTVTYGYISGLDRSVEVTDHDDTVIAYVDMIQITAAINPGNSGGPLFNCFGEVIAINTMKFSGDGYEGMGFAIPIGDVYPTLAERISEHRAANAPVEETTDAPETEVTPNTEPPVDAESETTAESDVILPDERPHASLGVRCETVTEKDSRLYKMPVGVILLHIEHGSYAMKHDLRVGDIILSVNGVEIPNVAALEEWAQNVRVGDTAEITVYRVGETVSITVTFADETPQDTPADIPTEEELPDAA